MLVNHDANNMTENAKQPKTNEGFSYNAHIFFILLVSVRRRRS